MNAREAIRNSPLAHYSDILERLLKPAIFLRTAPAEQPLPIGASKLGGAPDLPPDFEWPQWNAKLLSFLAQIRLNELAPYDVENLLPHSGMLYFFYEAEELPWGGNTDDAGAWRVIWYDGDLAHLRPTPLPSELCELCRFREQSIQFETIETLPMAYTEELELLAPELTLTDEEKDQFFTLADTLIPLDDLDSKRHWMLGYHWPIQSAANAEFFCCVQGLTWIEALARSQELTLLLQLDTDDDADMCWGDAGTLYFWIPQDALAARQFDKVWMIMQCC